MTVRVKNISLSTDVIMRNGDNNEYIEVYLNGPTIGIITLFKYLTIEQAPYYVSQFTYDNWCTYIKILFNESGKQFVINICIKHHNRLYERDLECFIASKSKRVNYINNDWDTHNTLEELSYWDAMILDEELSLSLREDISIFTDMY